MDQAIERRCAIGTFEYLLPNDMGLDVASVRIRTEASYTASLSQLWQDPAILLGLSSFDARLLSETIMMA